MGIIEKLSISKNVHQISSDKLNRKYCSKNKKETTKINIRDQKEAHYFRKEIMMRHFHLVENSWRTVWLITLFQTRAHYLALRELKFVIITESGTWYNCLVWVRSLICLVIKVRNERYSSFSTPLCAF